MIRLWLPEEGRPERLAIKLLATEAGEGEVLLLVYQGAAPLVTLTLRPRVVEVKSAAPARISGRASAAGPPLPQLLRTLYIIESGSEASPTFKYVLPPFGLRTSRTLFESPPLRTDRGRYVNSLYHQIETLVAETAEERDEFKRRLCAFGLQLFNDLFPPELQQVLWEHRDDIDCILVISTEPFIPWELVCLWEPGRPVPPGEGRFLAELGLTRWLHDKALPPPDSLKVRQGQARYVVPDYPHPAYKLEGALEEKRLLEDLFGATMIEPQPGPVIETIARPGSVDLLHFACHGVAAHENISHGHLLLQGNMRGGEYKESHLTAAEAQTYFNLATPDNSPLVMLNACRAGRAGYGLSGMGGFARAFISRGAGAFVGTLWAVGDGPALEFTKTFYTALKEGARLYEAVASARRAARDDQQYPATWLAYVVYGNPYLRMRDGD